MDSLYRNQVFLWEMTSILVHFTMICKNLIKCHVQTTLQLSNELFAGKFYWMIWSIWNIFPQMIIPGFTSKKGKSKSKFYIERVNLEGRVLPFRLSHCANETLIWKHSVISNSEVFFSKIWQNLILKFI